LARRTVNEILVNQDWCKRCGICVAFCPKNVFSADEFGRVSVEHLDACISCEICERLCPDLAITLLPREGEGTK